MIRWVIGILGVLLLVGAAMMIKTNLSDVSFPAAKDDKKTLINTERLRALEQLSESSIDTSHLNDDLLPPTNKWYSGMVLNKEPKPGFNVPNSILPRSDGFELGLPAITSTSDGIYGPHVNGLQVLSRDVSSYKLSRYDELTITLTYFNKAGQEVFDVTFASGSPYGFIVAKRDVTINLASGAVQRQSNGVTAFKNGHAWYGAKATNGQSGSTIMLGSGDELAVFSAPDRDAITTLAEQAENRILSGEVRYEVAGTEVKTTLAYKTKNNQPSVLVHMPHHDESRRPYLGYPSLYGELSAYKTATIEYTQPVQELKWSLPLMDLSAEDKSDLTTQLRADIASTQLDKPDTYFAGKQLQRLAQLVIVADTIGEKEQRDAALKKLIPAISKWLDKDKEKSFYYDKTAKALVGREASFGSDKELNDHHFHYGYFIYAASVAAKYDEEFLGRHKDDINLLVADIANYTHREAFPIRRNFDAYAGHSWASGLANYMDGNNQESSSEAVNAWTAVGLWAEVTENDSLREDAKWLLANEVATANEYWLKKPSDDKYISPIVSINWGGKREYKTFFSDEPNAKLAIQLLPLTPTMQPYVARLPDAIFKHSSVDKPYGDFVLMARGDAFDEIRSYRGPIDDGNSKAYMMAYALSR